MYIFAAFLIVSLFEPLYCLDFFLFCPSIPNVLDGFFDLEIFLFIHLKTKPHKKEAF